MRVLRIDSWDGQRGGAQEYVRSVSDELAARGHPQRLLNLVSRETGVVQPDERYLRIPGSGGSRRARDLLPDEEFAGAFREEIATFRPDLIHLHHFDALFGSIGRAIDRSSLPVVFTAHDAELVCPISTLIRPGNVVCDGGVRFRCLFTGCHVGLGGPYNLWQTRRFDADVAPKVRAFLCPSVLLARYLDSNGYRPAVHLAPFVRLPPDVPREPYPLPPPGGPPTVGFLGRLEPYKGLQVLLEAACRLRGRFPNLIVDVAGDGPYRETLADRARSLGIADTIRWRGDLRGEAKESWFRGLDLLVVPSTAWENFGFVALEALSRGRPVVATNFGGLPDIVQDGETGRLVPVGDASALAEAIGSLLGDRERLAQFAAEGRRRALARFRPEEHVERLLEIYRNVVAGAPPETEASRPETGISA